MTLLMGFNAPDVAVFMLRLATGVFFALSGWHKLVIPERHANLRATLEADHIPFIRFNEWFVPLVELVAGALLAIGVLAVPSAGLLIAICLVACLTDGIPQIGPRFHPINKADWLDDLLYLPEVCYLLMLMAIALIGPGAYSVDAMMFPFNE